MCSSALPCVCVIYKIITARDWFRVTLYLNCAQISLVPVDNWENFPRGTKIDGDFIYFRFQNLTPILTALSQVYYQRFVSFHQNKHKRSQSLNENEIFVVNEASRSQSVYHDWPENPYFRGFAFQSSILE